MTETLRTDPATCPAASVGLEGGSYQHCRPLTEDEYAALKADIEMHGVLEYVHVDENGAILVGHHRARAAAELGIEYPRHVVTGLSEQQKHEYAVRLESLGRSRDLETKKYTALDLWHDPAVKTSKTQLAALVGVHEKTIRNWIVEDGERTAAQPPPVEQIGEVRSTLPEPERVLDSRGRAMPTSYQPRQPRPPDEPSDEPEPDDAPPVGPPPTGDRRTMADILGPNPEPFDDAGLAEEMAAVRRRERAAGLLIAMLRFAENEPPEIMTEGIRPDRLPTVAAELAVVVRWLTRAHALAVDPRAQIRRVP